MELSGRLLEQAARATPATVEEHRDGWWFRHSEAEAWWAGAVLAHPRTDEAGRLTERIGQAEQFFADRGVPARFQVCPACPRMLDAVLAERGYLWCAPISLQTLTVAATARLPSQQPSLTLTTHPKPHADWAAVLARTSSPSADIDGEIALLHRITSISQYVTAYVDGTPAAIGRVVAEAGWAGVFQLATTVAARRRGAARLVLAAIAHWARTQAAPRLYLQVECANIAACRLYASVGFTELATYHYRVQPVDDRS